MLCFQACTASTRLSNEEDLEGCVSRSDNTSNAELPAICQEAGMHAEQMTFFRRAHSDNMLHLQACTASMNLSDEVDLEDYVSRPDKISNAEISAICQEAGMHAVRKNRYVILPKDFEKGYKSNVKKSDTDFEFYQ